MKNHLSIQQIVDNVITVEGGYTNNPADKGGPTNFGITQATLSAYRGKHATPEDVRALTKEEARAIYLARYVQEPGFDQIETVSAAVAEELVDTGVNMGVVTAGTFLQRALNALNREGDLYPDLKVDGRCGPATRAALRTYLGHRDAAETVLLRTLNCLQGARYVELAEQRPANERFVYGWMRGRVAL